VIGVLISAVLPTGLLIPAATYGGDPETPEQYAATWESLTQHPVPEWLLDARLTIKTLNANEELSTRGIASVSMLGSEADLRWSQDDRGRSSP